MTSESSLRDIRIYKILDRSHRRDQQWGPWTTQGWRQSASTPLNRKTSRAYAISVSHLKTIEAYIGMEICYYRIYTNVHRFPKKNEQLLQCK